MGIQTMGSQGDNNNANNKHSHYQPLSRQNSMYSLTLDEVQNQLGDLGKPLSSMNLDELLKNVLSAEVNQSIGVETNGPTPPNNLPRQGSLTINGALSKKTVDEVWRDIQQSKNDTEKKSQDRQPTLGEITLEDFLVKAGVVAETSTEKSSGASAATVDANVPPQFPQGQWMQYPYQHPQPSMIGVYMPTQPMPMVATAPAVMDVSHPENQVAIAPPMMGAVSDSQTTSRKRGAPEEFVEKNVERRQKRMIKNRESAARSRARKQAYTNELENKVSRLEEENERLRKRKELEKMLPAAPPPEPKYQLRRTSSAPL